ncbi:efflux pump antibiotic resistance protein [Apiospora marii]|uniref:efflux pump antibiotic resistance protein n=1 Tax=Apiospora marii TaxID=335849 RepID=UPI00312F3267
MGINFGGTEYEWSSGSEIALLVMIFVLLVAFILVTIYHPGVPVENRLLPIQVLTRLEIFIVPFQATLVAGGMFISIYYTPILFQFTRGDGALDGGVRILPLICMIVFFCLLSGALLPKLGYYMPWYVVGNSLILVGAALMLTINADTPTPNIYGYTVLIGIGVGCYQSSGVAVMSSIVPQSDVNNAVSIMTIAQVLGILAALSTSGAIFQNLVLEKLTTALPNTPKEDILLLTSGTSGNLFKSLPPDTKSNVIQQITIAIRYTFGYVVGTAALGLVLSFFLGRKKLYGAGGAIAA